MRFVASVDATWLSLREGSLSVYQYVQRRPAGPVSHAEEGYFPRTTAPLACAAARRAVWKSTILAVSTGSPAARIRTASRPALRAFPIATVATGTPAGICTIDSNESMPSRYLSGTGTPMTGNGVRAASMPGRWAAPPAPAMITSSPRSCAVRPYATMSSGCLLYTSDAADEEDCVDLGG